MLVFNGCMLLLEVKWTGTEIKEFLHRRFKELTARNKYTKVFLLFGDMGENDDGINVYPYIFREIWIYSNGKVTKEPCDNERLKDLLRTFKRWAEKQ